MRERARELAKLPSGKIKSGSGSNTFSDFSEFSMGQTV